MSWMTVLLTLGVALIGVGGVALGAWLNQHGAAAVAKQNFEGQRLLARDAALRDWRKQQIAPYLEAATNRTRIWVEMGHATGANDRTRLVSLGERLKDYHFDNLMVTYLAIPDDAFRAAFQKFLLAEGKLKPTSTYTKEEAWGVIMKMRSALVDLNKAAEHFIGLR